MLFSKASEIGLEKVEVVGPLNLLGELACWVPTFIFIQRSWFRNPAV